ncbi:hypothetical protein BO99DRAFT_112220 [Aspergillus violaceofuscus CBS 115571]|uniref:Uncharacterized protein n=1 Tax=Aspergillus violaceofuscus (strain CBS 115571) TaxID=1450538 RepID=A0A2V5H8A8_ASPV1|nr:hypothetical protein BO99DRAFT_112220 [Aspergillus violaceofuscus CBS 115571]
MSSIYASVVLAVYVLEIWFPFFYLLKSPIYEQIYMITEIRGFFFLECGFRGKSGDCGRMDMR